MAFSGVVPVVYSPAIMYLAFESRHWGALMASGVVNRNIFKSLRGGDIIGDKVHIPYHKRPDDFQYLDVTSLTAATAATQVNTGDNIFPVSHAWSQMTGLVSDDYRAGENFKPRIIQGLADKAAKHMMRMATLIMDASLSGISTHNTDVGRANLTVNALGEAMAKREDVSGELTTLLVHPDVYHDLSKELREDYKDNPIVGTFYLESPRLRELLGIKRIIQSKVVHKDTTSQEDAWAVSTAYVLGDIIRPTTKNGFEYECTTAGTSHASVEPTWSTTLGATTADDGTLVWTTVAVPDKYASFLLGQNSFNLGFQKETRMSVSDRIDLDNMPWVIRAYIDIVMGFKGTTYSGGALPNDATIGSAANWAKAADDDRDLLAGRIFSQSKRAGSTFIST